MDGEVHAFWRVTSKDIYRKTGRDDVQKAGYKLRESLERRFGEEGFYLSLIHI